MHQLKTATRVTCDCKASMIFFFFIHSFIVNGFVLDMDLNKLNDELILCYFENFYFFIFRMYFAGFQCI